MTEQSMNRVRVEPADARGVGTVTMIGGAENYLTVFLLRDLVTALQELSGDPACGAIVVRSEGKHFCAGRDWATARDPEDTAEAIYATAPELLATGVPWVAELTGGSIGVGFGLSMCADYRVISETAYAWPRFVEIGIHHGFGLTATLEAAVGHQRAMEMLSTGRRISSDEAVAVGLADLSAGPGAIAQAAQDFAARLAAQPRRAAAAIRETMRDPVRRAFAEAVRHERAAQVRLYESDDFQEATQGGYRYERA